MEIAEARDATRQLGKPMNRNHLADFVRHRRLHNRCVLLGWLLIALALVGCKRSGPSSSNVEAGAEGELLVSAAASLRDALQEINRLYEERT
ncbi:MAG: hypothetical protein H0T92_22360, partial [Pyrinomonadaceae bacterium]|nr:hypothetical protein [Pyrinomonadaceae bacterium]